jgi:hypothetical protein
VNESPLLETVMYYAKPCNQYMIYSCQTCIYLRWLLPESGGCAVTKVATIGQTYSIRMALGNANIRKIAPTSNVAV